jgi:pimeloyl-ACP methyl ester carboxylesterase
VTINQMYVEYMVPAGAPKVPVVLIHGAGLSGKSYDTTPDGRMGWFEYFVRKSYPTYVVDQVGRARSGFDHAPSDRRLASQPTAESAGGAFRFGDRVVWTSFRFGPRAGEKFPDTKFPTEAISELSKQAIPDMTAFVPIPNPTFKALADLASDLKGAVLISHSQSGHFPMEAALLNPAGIRAVVALEPARCGNELFSDAQIARIAKVPALVVFGDYLPSPTGAVTWQDRLENCKKYATRIRAAGGKIDLLETPSLGVRGNSHMLMQDVNNAQIADRVMAWIDANAGVQQGRPAASRALSDQCGS